MLSLTYKQQYNFTVLLIEALLYLILYFILLYLFIVHTHAYSICTFF